MLLPLGITDEENLNSDGYDWIPAISISNVIDIGLIKPFRGFRFYLDSNQKYIRNVIITFTINGYIIFGLSIDDEIKDIDFAKKILNNVFNEYQGINGGIFFEEPAPLSTKKFSHMLNQSEVRI